MKLTGYRCDRCGFEDTIDNSIEVFFPDKGTGIMVDLCPACHVRVVAECTAHVE